MVFRDLSVRAAVPRVARGARLRHLAAGRTPRSALVTAALLCAFVLAHFGKDHQYAFTADEVAAGRFV